MLFTIELFDTVASVVVLTEVFLLLPIVKDGILVPGRSGMGTRFTLQNVDCTRNDEVGRQKPQPQGRAQKVASSACTFINSVGHDIKGFGFDDRRHCEEKVSSRNERKLAVIVVVIVVEGG